MPCKGQQASGISGHPIENGQYTVSAEGFQYIPDPLDMVAPPPCAALLYLTGHPLFHKRTAEHGKRFIAGWVKGKQYRFGEGTLLLQIVQQSGKVIRRTVSDSGVAPCWTVMLRRRLLV